MKNSLVPINEILHKNNNILNKNEDKTTAVTQVQALVNI